MKDSVDDSSKSICASGGWVNWSRFGPPILLNNMLRVIFNDPQGLENKLVLATPLVHIQLDSSLIW